MGLEIYRACSSDNTPWRVHPQVKTGAWFEDDPEPLHGVDSHIQQKILPWDKLELVRGHGFPFRLDLSSEDLYVDFFWSLGQSLSRALPKQAVEVANASSLEQTTAAGKRRQSIVLCATLVDKVRLHVP